MPRRKANPATIVAENEHLIGLQVGRASPTVPEYGNVVDLHVVDGLPMVVVDFPDSGPIELPVIRRRRPRDIRLHYIRLRSGEQDGLYHWVNIDAALIPPPPRVPEASFCVHVEARTWARTAAKRKQALAGSLAEGLAEGIEDALEGFADAAPLEVRIKPEATRRGESDAFDLTLTIDAFSVDAATAEEIFRHVAYTLDATADDPDRWPSYLASRDLKKIHASDFTLEGTVGGERLGPVRGRLPLR